jgi:hypothetical protein
MVTLMGAGTRASTTTSHPRFLAKCQGVPNLFAEQPPNIQGLEGIPNVEGLPRDLRTRQGEQYMERFFLLGGARTPGWSARFHHILGSDSRDLHDHPWDFISVILAGSYTETTASGDETYGPGSVLTRKAEHLHRLTLQHPVWTFVLTGPARRDWGFQTARGWVNWYQYEGAV